MITIFRRTAMARTGCLFQTRLPSSLQPTRDRRAEVAPGVTPYSVHGFSDADAELTQHSNQHGVLVLQMPEYHFDFLLRLHVDFQVMLSTQLGMGALNILTHHD